MEKGKHCENFDISYTVEAGNYCCHEDIDTSHKFGVERTYESLHSSLLSHLFWCHVCFPFLLSAKLKMTSMERFSLNKVLSNSLSQTRSPLCHLHGQRITLRRTLIMRHPPLMRMTPSVDPPILSQLPANTIL
ncbi:hypothetical protein XENOCAPTIV_028469 [Xenoophorus captivus]|uniref:Uncharacterized protein n=1 Tax=Xenoophorus captivus TaxID=1517983 RepID=A0ABV0QY03_9TELE